MKIIENVANYPEKYLRKGLFLLPPFINLPIDVYPEDVYIALKDAKDQRVYNNYCILEFTEKSYNLIKDSDSENHDIVNLKKCNHVIYNDRYYILYYFSFMNDMTKTIYDYIVNSNDDYFRLSKFGEKAKRQIIGYYIDLDNKVNADRKLIQTILKLLFPQEHLEELSNLLCTTPSVETTKYINDIGEYCSRLDKDEETFIYDKNKMKLISSYDFSNIIPT